jgi:methylmalonyl-CoA mutase cobalamin-binding subunit
VIERIPELQDLARAAGRGQIPVSYFPQSTAGEIERLAEAGVERCIYYVPPDGRDQALAKLEELGRMIQPYLAAGR